MFHGLVHQNEVFEAKSSGCGFESRSWQMSKSINHSCFSSPGGKQVPMRAVGGSCEWCYSLVHYILGSTGCILMELRWFKEWNKWSSDWSCIFQTNIHYYIDDAPKLDQSYTIQEKFLIFLQWTTQDILPGGNGSICLHAPGVGLGAPLINITN